MRRHREFQKSYLATLRYLRAHGMDVEGVVDPTSVGSRFGKVIRPTKEILADSFCISNPRHRLLESQRRKLSPAFLVANAVWTIGGGHDAAMISSYNSRGRDFARDQSYFEASFGIRLFASGHQIRHVERRLRQDQRTRRATAVIYTSEDTVVDRLDVPCALNLQFFVRNDRLHCLTIMRSQSAAMVMPYDVFLFTLIQEILAVRLGLQLGPYLHFAGSMHYYSEEAQLVESLLKERASTPAPMPVMQEASDRTLEELVQAEQFIRLTKRSGADMPISLERFDLDDYWKTFLMPLITETFDGIHKNWWSGYNEPHNVAESAEA